MRSKMNYSILMLVAITTLSVTACDKPTVVNVPPPPVAVPGPPGPSGPQGSTGEQGKEGNKGEIGKTGEGTTIVVVPTPVPTPTATN
jgi:hypothetical protein